MKEKTSDDKRGRIGASVGKEVKNRAAAMMAAGNKTRQKDSKCSNSRSNCSCSDLKTQKGNYVIKEKR